MAFWKSLEVEMSGPGWDVGGESGSLAQGQLVFLGWGGKYVDNGSDTKQLLDLAGT